MIPHKVLNIRCYICTCLALFFIFVFIRLLEYQILQFHASWFKLKGTQGSCKTQFSFIMEIIFIGIAVILGIWLLFHAAIYLWVLFEEYVLPILIFCGVGSFFFWLIFWIFGIKEIFGISTMIIGAVIGFILWIWITFFGDNGGHSDYEHEDMDHDMPIHVKIDN